MEAMNQSGQPRKSGKRGPMRPAPLTSGGLALEGVTCRGWGPHLQYSFLIKLASLSGKLASLVSGTSEGPKPWALPTHRFTASTLTIAPQWAIMDGNKSEEAPAALAQQWSQLLPWTMWQLGLPAILNQKAGTPKIAKLVKLSTYHIINQSSTRHLNS